MTTLRSKELDVALASAKSGNVPGFNEVAGSCDWPNRLDAGILATSPVQPNFCRGDVNTNGKCGTKVPEEGLRAMSFDLVIRGGTVATCSEVAKCDIGVKEGRIVALADRLTNAARVIDAAGHYVTPGGVDTHCHIEEPAAGDEVIAGSFETETASAIAGGTTTIIPFVVQQTDLTMRQSVDAYKLKAMRSRIDFSFHLIITDAKPSILNELPSLIQEGNRSLKVFTTYELYRLDDAAILDVLRVAKQNDALVCVHAENDAGIRYLTAKLLADGKTAAKYHAESRPIEFEAEAIRRIATFAALVDTPVQFFHVSGAAAVNEVASAIQKSPKVFGETCPQYLVFTAEDLGRDGGEGEKFVFSPPARTTNDQLALWAAIRSGVLNIISSDHCPLHHFQPNWPTERGARPFTKIPSGIPGIGARLPVLFSEGVAKGRISLERFVAITATNPARLHGLAPRKGTIAIGSDADLIIWDAEKRQTVTNADWHHANDFTPYEGIEIQGWPEMTIVGGEIGFKDGAVLRDSGRGSYIARGPFQLPF